MWFKSYEHYHQWTKPTELMLSKPSSVEKAFYACQWLDNVDMQPSSIEKAFYVQMYDSG